MAEFHAVPAVLHDLPGSSRKTRGFSFLFLGFPLIPSDSNRYINVNIKLNGTDTGNLVDGSSFSIRVLLCHRPFAD